MKMRVAEIGLCIIFINGGFPELRKKINAANFL